MSDTYPVDSSTRTCCGGIGRHTRDCVEKSAVEKGAQALWEACPYLCEDFSYEWFIKAARVVLEAGK